MTIVKQMDIRSHIKKYFDMAFNGETLIIKGTMKPIPTMKKTLATVDLKDMSPANAHFERSDVCAVPACSVVAEARVAIILVDELLAKIGGDNFVEMKAHYGL